MPDEPMPIKRTRSRLTGTQTTSELLEIGRQLGSHQLMLEDHSMRLMTLERGYKDIQEHLDKQDKMVANLIDQQENIIKKAIAGAMDTFAQEYHDVINMGRQLVNQENKRLEDEAEKQDKAEEWNKTISRFTPWITSLAVGGFLAASANFGSQVFNLTHFWSSIILAVVIFATVGVLIYTSRHSGK